jgi:protein ImuB
MFACLYSLSVPVAALVRMAQDFTPRFEVVGPLVMLDIGGLSRLFGSPRDIGEQLRHAATGPVRIALAPTQTAAALLALGRPGLAVIEPEGQRGALAPLMVSVLGEFERVRLSRLDQSHPLQSHPSPQPQLEGPLEPGRSTTKPSLQPPNVGEMADVLPYFQSSLGRTSDAAAAPHRPRGDRGSAPATAAEPNPLSAPAVPVSGGWMHPRDSHAAAQTRRPRRPLSARERGAPASARTISRDLRRDKAQQAAIDALLETLRRWGIRTFGELAALPPGDVYERLGARGVLWQRLARGEETTPLVPWVPEDPFEAALELEWPIEGLEPLSFVLGRLFDPLSERLERADRGAAILHTHLHLVNKTVHARMLQLPSPMRDAKTLRTLVLLDLESNPPTAAIDQVRVLVEPTPGRVTQWALFERAQPSPEQVSTLLARLKALMGDSHVGSPQLVDSWKPGVFEMTPFILDAPTALSAPDAPVAPGAPGAPVAPSALGAPGVPGAPAPSAPSAPSAPGAPSAAATALRRFRLPVPARVHVSEGRPTRIVTDRRGVTGGAVVQSAGPWRTSGEWWNDAQPGRSWDRDEWDVALTDGTIYRIYVERDIGQWFLEGVVD